MDTIVNKRMFMSIEPTIDSDLSKLRNNDVMDFNRENEFVNAQILRDVRHIMDSLRSRNAKWCICAIEIYVQGDCRMPGVSINTSTWPYALCHHRACTP